MKEIYLEEIGTIRLVKHARARHLKISVRGRDDIRMTIPQYVSYKSALNFLNNKIEWVSRAREKFNPPKHFLQLALEEGRLKTLMHDFYFVEAGYLPSKEESQDKRAIFIHPNTIPGDTNLPDLEQLLYKALRKSAKQYLPSRLKELADLHGFQFEQVRIKNLKSRWGSCSGRNNINLNLKLMFLPAELVDYVLIHELVHTKIKNHGPDFWKMVEQILPLTNNFRRALKKYAYLFV